MKKVTRFLAVIGSIAISAIGCYLFAEGFTLLSSSHMLVKVLGAGFLMMGVYDFVSGWWSRCSLERPDWKSTTTTIMERMWTNEF